VKDLSDDHGEKCHSGEGTSGSDEGDEFPGFHGEQSGDEECFVAEGGDEYEGEDLVEASAGDFAEEGVEGVWEGYG